MTDEKCPAQSFHMEKYHKGHYFIGCNYYGMIVDVKRCEKCKVNSKNMLMINHYFFGTYPTL